MLRIDNTTSLSMNSLVDFANNASKDRAGAPQSNTGDDRSDDVAASDDEVDHSADAGGDYGDSDLDVPIELEGILK